MLQWGKDCEAGGEARDGLKTRRPRARVAPKVATVKFPDAAMLKLRSCARLWPARARPE